MKLPNIPGTSPMVCGSVFCSEEKGYFISRNTSAINAYELWLFDGQLNSWTKLADFPSTTSISQNVLIWNLTLNGSVLYVLDNKMMMWMYYAPPKDNWWCIPDSKYPGMGLVNAARVSSTSGVVVGLGSNGLGEYYNDIWQFDLSTRKWIKKKDFPGETRNQNWTCFEVNNKIYFIASLTSTSATTQNSWIYDIQNDIWISMSNGNTPFYNLEGQSFNINDEIYVFGGSVFWKFNPYDQ